MTTRKAALLQFPLALALAAGLAGTARADGGGAALQWHEMTPIPSGLAGRRVEPLRNQAAGGLPWVIQDGHGTLHSNGKLQVHVRGLVLADDPAVPEALRLTNPIPTFRAVVSCVTSTGAATTSQTPAVSASSDGDAHIEAFVDPPLPHPCIAPIVFVGNGAQQQQDVAWFAATGVN